MNTRKTKKDATSNEVLDERGKTKQSKVATPILILNNLKVPDGHEKIVEYYSNIKITDLIAQENPDTMSTFVVGQILSMLPSKKDQNTYTYYQSKFPKVGKQKLKPGTSTYKRNFMFRDVACPNGTVFSIMEGFIGSSNKIFRTNPGKGMNAITIGDYMFLHGMEKVENFMNGDVPILEIYNVGTLLEENVHLNPEVKEVRINFSIESNHTLSFLLRNQKLRVDQTIWMKTMCGGITCDRQCIKEREERGNGCGCYCNTSGSSLIFGHKVALEKSDSTRDKEVHMKAMFSSLKFSRYYLNMNQYQSFKDLTILDRPDMMIPVKKAVSKFVRYVNDHGGFTVTGWYKRGVQTDIMDNETSMTDSLQSTDIRFHFIEIKPTDPDLQILDEMKINLPPADNHSS